MNSKENTIVLPRSASEQLVASDCDAEILAAYEQWRIAYDLSSQHDDDHHYALWNAAELALVSLQPKTARGLAIQLIAFSSFGDFGDMESSFFDFGPRLHELARVEPPSTMVNARLLPKKAVAA